MFNIKSPWPLKKSNYLNTPTTFTHLNIKTVENSKDTERDNILRDITNVDITVEKNSKFIYYLSNSRQLLTFA